MDLVPYFRAKWEVEQLVKGSGIDHVIFRPSFIFGPDGGIIPTFRKLVKLAPVTPIIGSGERRIQPIWVDDMAAYFVKALDLDGCDEPRVRDRRPGGRDVERVLGAVPAGAGRPAPADDPRARWA